YSARLVKPCRSSDARDHKRAANAPIWRGNMSRSLGRTVKAAGLTAILVLAAACSSSSHSTSSNTTTAAGSASTAAGSASTACSSGSSASSAPATGKSLTIGLISDVTGFQAPLTGAGLYTMEAAIAEANAKGGVNGYHINYKVYDSASSPAGGLNAAREAIA